MTQEVSAHYRERWDTQVRLRLQAKGNMLQGTVLPPMRIDANKFYFLRSGTLNASEWAGRGHAVNRQGSVDDTVEISSKEWDCPYELYDRDKWLTSASEEQTRQKQAGNALGVTADSIIYNAIMNATIPAENKLDVTADALTPYHLMELEARLFEKFTPNDGRIFAPVPIRSFEHLCTKKIFSSADWQGPDLPLTKRTKHKTYGSLNVFSLEQQNFTPYITGSAVRMRFWHSECVGAGYVGQQMRSEWKREADYKRWLVIHTLDGAAEVIEPEGIVEVTCNIDAVIEDEIQRTEAVV